MSQRCIGLLLTLALAQRGGGDVAAVEITPDGRTVIAAGMDGKVRFWDVATRRQRREVSAHKHGVWDLGLSGDGRRFITAGGDRLVRVWDLARVKEIQTLEGHDKEVAAVALSPDGERAASGGYGGDVLVWDVKTGAIRRRLKGHEYRVTALAFTPDGKRLISGGVAKRVIGGLTGLTEADRLRVWDLATGASERLSIRGQRLLVTPDGKGVAAAGMYVDLKPVGGAFTLEGGSRTVVWDLDRQRATTTLAQRGTGLALSANGKYLATAWGHNRHSGSLVTSKSDTRGVHLYEWDTGREVAKVAVPEKDAVCLALSADGRAAIAGRADGQVVFLDLRPEGWSKPAWSEEAGERAWKDLADGDAAKAYRAVWDLSSAAEAVALLRKRLKPASLKPEQVRRLIAELDSDDGPTRQKAREELARLDELVRPQLEEAVKTATSAEVRRSVQALLRSLERGRSPGALQASRAVDVLGRIGTRAARELLQALARGTPGLPLTEDARRAVALVQKQNP